MCLEESKPPDSRGCPGPCARPPPSAPQSARARRQGVCMRVCVQRCDLPGRGEKNRGGARTGRGGGGGGGVGREDTRARARTHTHTHKKLQIHRQLAGAQRERRPRRYACHGGHRRPVIRRATVAYPPYRHCLPPIATTSCRQSPRPRSLCISTQTLASAPSSVLPVKHFEI